MGGAEVSKVTEIKFFTLPAPYQYNNPKTIVSGPDGNLWFITDSSCVGRVSKGGTVDIFPIPTAASDIAVGPDGNIWLSRTDADTITVIRLDGSIAYEITLGGRATRPGKPTLLLPGNNHIYYLSTATPQTSICSIDVTGFVDSAFFPPAGIITALCLGKDRRVWYLKSNPSTIGNNGFEQYSTGMPQGVQFGNLFLDTDGLLTFPETSGPPKLDKFDGNNITQLNFNNFLLRMALVGADGDLWGIDTFSDNVTKYHRATDSYISFPTDGGHWNSICKDDSGDIWITKSSNAFASQPASIAHFTLDGAASFIPINYLYRISPSFNPPIYYSLPEFDSTTWSQMSGSIKELMRRHLLRIFYWDEGSQRFFELNNLSHPPRSVRGYLITSCVDLSFELKLPLVTSPHRIGLKPGWNFVSVPPILDAGHKLLQHQLSDFNLLDGRSAYIFEPQKSRSISIFSASAEPNAWERTTTIESGKAYWIKNSTNQSLTLMRMNTLTGGVVITSDSERTGGSGTGTGPSGGGGDPTELPPPVPALSAEAADQSHPCGTGSTVGLVLAMSSLLALRLRRRAA